MRRQRGPFRGRLLAALVVLMAVVAAACGDDDQATTTTTSPESLPESSTTTSAPEPTVPLVEYPVDQTDLDAPPGEVAVGEGEVWVTVPDEGSVVGIDPSTGEPSGDPLVIDEAVSQGDAFDFDLGQRVAVGTLAAGTQPVLWVTGRDARVEDEESAEATVISAVDPTTGDPIESVESDLGWSSGVDIAWGIDTLWILDLGDAVQRVVGDEGGLTTEDLGEAVDGPLAVSEDAIWLIDDSPGFGNEVLQIDPATGEPVGDPIPVDGNASDIAFGEGSLWVVADQIERIDPSTGEVVEQIPAPAEGLLRLAAGEGALWVINAEAADNAENGALYRIDLAAPR